MSDNQPQPLFNIEKLFVKDLSLEVPGAPGIFMESEAPAIELQLANGGGQFKDNLYETTLTVTVTAKRGEKVYFLVEVAQAGIFRIENIPQENIEPILGIACPNILFPYAREAISDAVSRAGFPPVLLAPVNFEALYQQRLEQNQAQAQAATPLQ